MFLLFGAFIAGMLTVLAPCVLPMLPIIIGGSVSGDTQDKKRPVVIAAALAVSLIVFTLLLKVTTVLINLPPQTINYVSGTIIVLLGVVILFPTLYVRIISWLGVEQQAQGLLGKGFQNKRRFVGPVIIGAALGPVFSSCSPVYAYILATVLPADFARAMIYIVAYVLGLSIVLLLIGHYGQRFISRIKWAVNPKGWFQRTVAVIFIIVGVLVFTGSITRVQVWASNHSIFNLDGLSSRLLPASKNKQNNSQLFNVAPYTAPEFTGIQSWINSPPLTTQQLKGKVVLVDFWTYSCINCIRNNTYLEKWYQAYKDDGLVIVGVHAPEFSFEKVLANVQKGVADQGITYPVGLDNNLATWNAYSNESWPASYLINPSGQVVRVHEGEGDYTDEEQAIRQLLTTNGAKLGTAVTKAANNAVPVTQQQTPETYFGTARASNYDGSPDLVLGNVQAFTNTTDLPQDAWALGGTWEVDEDKIVSRSDSTLSFHVAAKDVYLVGGSTSGDPAAITVDVDGKPVGQTKLGGSDVQGDTLTVGMPQLYRLLSFPSFSASHTVTLHVPAGVQLSTFTFGS